MALSKDDILNAIADMSVMEVVELVRSMEDKFGVSAAAAQVAVAPAGAGADEPAAGAEEQTEFTVVLAGVGDKKVNVIKAVRAITGLGLTDATARVDEAPSPLKEGVGKDESEEIRKQLEDAGASVEIK